VGATHTGTVTLFVFFVFIFFNNTIPVNQFLHTKAQKTWAGVRKTLFGMRIV